MRKLTVVAIFVVVLFSTWAGRAQAALSGTTTQMASGLSAPVFATFAPNDPNHLFVLQQGGAIRVVDLTTKSVLATPFLMISDTDAANEGGLLGLAFDPNYANPGKTGYGQFYVYVTVDSALPVPGGTAATATSSFSTHIRRYSVSSNPLVANTGSVQEIMTWPRPQTNHVGGWIGFGPKDGYLYINSGDGGNGNDVGAGHFEPGGNAQNIVDYPNDLMGKQLRIDVNNTQGSLNYAIPAGNPFKDGVDQQGNPVPVTGQDEIWSYGLRNPYRASFDRDTGNMWIGDVGQDAREEIDRELATRSGVSNYGWRLREGNNGTVTPPNYLGPVYDYASTAPAGNAVVGGYVYRGPDPSLQGTYFFADEVTGEIWKMDTSTFAVTNINGSLTPDTGSLASPSSFAEDVFGNLYMVTYGGRVFRINTNQLLAGDINASGTVDISDYTAWRKSGTGSYAAFRENFGQTVHTTGFGAPSLVPEAASAFLAAQVLVVVAAVARGRRRR